MKDKEYSISAGDNNIFKKIDSYVGWFLRNMPSNSNLIIMSDHGEFLGEHDTYFTHCAHFQEALKAALIIKLPNRLYKNKQPNFVTLFVDRVPTIMDFFTALIVNFLLN